VVFVGRAERQQASAIAHLVADSDAHFGDNAGVWRLDNMLHFHRLEDDERLILGDVLAFRDGYFHDATRHRGGESPLATASTFTRDVVDAQRRRSPQAVAAALPFDDTAIAIGIEDDH
jgi:hypothetical protein